MKKLETKIAGTTHPNEDGMHRMRLLCRLYDRWWMEGLEHEIKLELRPEDNEHDADAVGVWCVEPEETQGRLGFVPRDRARLIKLAHRAGRLHSVKLKTMKTGSGGAVWCLLLVRISDNRNGRSDNRNGRS